MNLFDRIAMSSIELKVILWQFLGWRSPRRQWHQCHCCNFVWCHWFSPYLGFTAIPNDWAQRIPGIDSLSRKCGRIRSPEEPMAQWRRCLLGGFLAYSEAWWSGHFQGDLQKKTHLFYRLWKPCGILGRTPNIVLKSSVLGSKQYPLASLNLQGGKPMSADIMN